MFSDPDSSNSLRIQCKKGLLPTSYVLFSKRSNSLFQNSLYKHDAQASEPMWADEFTRLRVMLVLESGDV